MNTGEYATLIHWETGEKVFDGIYGGEAPVAGMVLFKRPGWLNYVWYAEQRVVPCETILPPADWQQRKEEMGKWSKVAMMLR